MFLCQCHQQKCDKLLDKYIHTVRQERTDLTTPKIYYFIPIGGCQTCVMKSIEFSKSKLGDPNIVFVLVSQTGRKSITIHYNEQELASKNILIDGSGEAYKQNVIGSNITIYYKVDNCFIREDVVPANFDERLSFVKKLIKEN